MLSCDEQFLAEVGGLGGAVGQQLQHALYHLLRVLPYQVLIGQTHATLKAQIIFSNYCAEARYVPENYLIYK